MVARDGLAKRADGLNGNGRHGRAPTPPATVRVGVYCRQSVADDLEFGSIDAQREAVEAFVASQRGEGWVALPERYDDGGFSGANTERPAFQRLVADVEAGRVDVVAVYKIDRVSRSLPDFVRFMEQLDRRGVGFVSITQSFDTRTSMGRLTLNILASFSQFERETIAERTRDKMLASRRKGMWTGGQVPLGYDVVDKKLVVNAREAEQVREIFAAYLAQESLGSTLAELDRRGLRGKSWTTRDGVARRGKRFAKSTLAHLLTNPTYVGNQRCGQETVEGRHEAIVDRATWDAAQQLLREHRRGGSDEKRNKWGALLKGLVTCVRCGRGFSHTFTLKGGRAYRYYCCQTLQERGADACPGSRVAAGDLEDFVVDRIREVGRDPALVRQVVERARELQLARIPALSAELRRLTQEAARLDGERKNLLAALGEGGGARSALLSRLAEVDDALARAVARRRDASAELAAAEAVAIDEANLRDALAAFAPVWTELFPREQARIISLLIEEVRYDAQAGEVSLTFRPGGVRALAAEARGPKP